MTEKEPSEEMQNDEDIEQQTEEDTNEHNSKLTASSSDKKSNVSQNDSPENESLSVNTNKSEFDGGEHESVDISSISAKNVDASPSEQIDDQQKAIEDIEQNELESDVEFSGEEEEKNLIEETEKDQKTVTKSEEEEDIQEKSLPEPVNEKEESNSEVDQDFQQEEIKNTQESSNNNNDNKEQIDENQVIENNENIEVNESKTNENNDSKSNENSESNQNLQNENVEENSQEIESPPSEAEALLQPNTELVEYTEVELSASITPQNTPKSKNKKKGKGKKGKKAKGPKKAKSSEKSSEVPITEVPNEEDIPKEEGNESPVEEGDKPNNADEDNVSIASEKSTASKQSIKSEHSIQSTASKQSAVSNKSKQSTKSAASKQSTKSNKSEQSTKSTTSKQSVVSNKSTHSIKSTASKQSIKSEKSNAEVGVTFEIEAEAETETEIRNEEEELTEGHLGDIEEQLMLGEPVDGLSDRQYERVVKDLISKRDAAETNREKRRLQRAAELAANCKTLQSESIAADDELSAAHAELARFDAEMGEILIKMHRENDERRARLLKTQQIQEQRLDAEWASDAKALRYCRASANLVKMRQNLKALRSRNKDREADEYQKIVDRTAASEQEAAGKIMQHDYDDAIQKLRTRQEDERDFMETQFAVRISQFEREREKMRANLMKKINKAERKVMNLDFSGTVVRGKNSNSASVIGNNNNSLDETMIALPALKKRSEAPRRTNILKNEEM